MSTTNLALPQLIEGQASAETTHNDALNILDAINAPALIQDRDLSAAPGSPGEGEVWLVSGTPGGGDAWETHGADLAIYQTGWIFVTPTEGMVFFVEDEDVYIRYNGTAWVILGGQQTIFGHYENPAALDEATLYYFEEAVTIRRMQGVKSNAGTSLDVQLHHSTDRNAAGNEVFSADRVIDDDNTGNAFVDTFDDNTIPASSWLWIEVPAISGVPTWFSVSIVFTKD